MRHWERAFASWWRHVKTYVPAGGNQRASHGVKGEGDIGGCLPSLRRGCPLMSLLPVDLTCHGKYELALAQH